MIGKTILVFALFSTMSMSVNAASGLQCDAAHAASKYKDSGITDFVQSKEFEGFYREDQAKAASHGLLGIVSRSKNGGEFVKAVQTLVKWKAGQEMDLTSERNFNSMVLPGLIRVSKHYELSARDQSRISETLKAYSTSEKARSYSRQTWGGHPFYFKLQKFGQSSGFRNFRAMDSAQHSAQFILTEASASAKNGNEFVDILESILEWKNEHIFGKVADRHFNLIMWPKLLQISQNYTLTPVQRSEITGMLKGYATKAGQAGGDFALDMTRQFWGRSSFFSRLIKNRVPDYITEFSTDRNVALDAIRTMVYQSENSADFIDRMEAILVWKTNVNLGSHANEFFSDTAMNAIFAIAAHFEISTEQQNQISQIIENYAQNETSDISPILRYTRAVWGRFNPGRE